MNAVYYELFLRPHLKAAFDEWLQAHAPQEFVIFGPQPRDVDDEWWEDETRNG